MLQLLDIHFSGVQLYIDTCIIVYEYIYTYVLVGMTCVNKVRIIIIKLMTTLCLSGLHLEDIRQQLSPAVDRRIQIR